MKDKSEYWMLYLALILFGVFLYALGNIVFGKKRHGGKRLILLVVGLLMIGIGGGIITAGVAGIITEGIVSLLNDRGSLILVVLLFLFGLAILVAGIWMIIRSFSSDAKKVDKTFDSLTDGF